MTRIQPNFADRAQPCDAPAFAAAFGDEGPDRAGRHCVGDMREFEVSLGADGWSWFEAETELGAGPFATSEQAYRSALLHLG